MVSVELLCINVSNQNAIIIYTDLQRLTFYATKEKVKSNVNHFYSGELQKCCIEEAK